MSCIKNSQNENFWNSWFGIVVCFFFQYRFRTKLTIQRNSLLNYILPYVLLMTYINVSRLDKLDRLEEIERRGRPRRNFQNDFYHINRIPVGPKNRSHGTVVLYYSEALWSVYPVIYWLQITTFRIRETPSSWVATIFQNSEEYKIKYR